MEAPVGSVATDVSACATRVGVGAGAGLPVLLLLVDAESMLGIAAMAPAGSLGGGAAAASVPPRKASALYWAWLRSAANDSVVCCCSSDVVCGFGLSGSAAISGACPLSLVGAAAGESSPNHVVGSTQSGTDGMSGKLEQALALNTTADRAVIRKNTFFMACMPRIMESSSVAPAKRWPD
jgi:hypothetical protein